ncbi:MAG: hypothetical protein AAB214_05145 [Fibrobacterota bacterium]
MGRITAASVRRRLRGRVVAFLKDTRFCHVIYPAWWRQKLGWRSSNKAVPQYFTSIPNPGAGIGHQMANWIAGRWFAQVFGLAFAHIPFASPRWEEFLGFGTNEVTVRELVFKHGYRIVRLPLFSEFDQRQLELIRRMIGVYCGKKIIFVCEQDQFYRDQFGVIDIVREKFHARHKSSSIELYKEKVLHIAIHVRRGDIVSGQTSGNPNLQMRWQNVDYFDQALRQITAVIPSDIPYLIHLFSQGERSEFSLFDRFPGMRYHLGSDEMETFLHFAFADILVTSKSSFSYKPALLSNGIKICPRNFWHGYPQDTDWFLVNDSGDFEKDDLDRFGAELSKRFPSAG